MKDNAGDGAEPNTEAPTRARGPEAGEGDARPRTEASCANEAMTHGPFSRISALTRSLSPLL